MDERTRIEIRQLDLASLIVLAIAAVPIGALSFFLPHQGWLSFGAFMLFIYVASWIVNRWRIKASRKKSSEKVPGGE